MCKAKILDSTWVHGHDRAKWSKCLPKINAGMLSSTWSKTPFRIPFPAIHVQSHMARALQRLLAQASLVWLTMTSPNNDHLSSSTYLTTSNIYDISIADFWSLVYVLRCVVLVWILPCKMSSLCLNSKHHWTFVKTIFLLSQRDSSFSVLIIFNVVSVVWLPSCMRCSSSSKSTPKLKPYLAQIPRVSKSNSDTAISSCIQHILKNFCNLLV